MGQLATLLGGAGLTGLANSGRQGGQNTNSSFAQSGSSRTNDFGSASNSATSRQIENPLLNPFRGSLIGNLQGEIARAQQPIFGSGDIAGAIGGINTLANRAGDALSSRLARRGALNSNSLAAGLGDVERARGSETTNFLLSLPERERAARAQLLTPLLGAGLGFVGRGTVDTENTGQSSFESTGQRLFDQQGTSQSETEQFGPSWWKSILGEVGGVLGLPGANRGFRSNPGNFAQGG